MDKLADYRDIDRLIHEPARYMIMAYLYVVSQADFVFLARKCDLSGGNLSSHTSKLEDAGYIRVEKAFVDKRPQTTFELTKKGRAAFEDYRKMMAKALSWGKK